MVIVDFVVIVDDNVFIQELSDMVFCWEQFCWLKDEVIEFEDVWMGVFIIDFGLNDFCMDLFGYMKEYGDFVVVLKGLYVVVLVQLVIGLEFGVFFVFCNVNFDECIN